MQAVRRGKADGMALPEMRCSVISESDRNRIERSRIARYEPDDDTRTCCCKGIEQQVCDECQGVSAESDLTDDDVKLAKWEAAQEDGRGE